MALFADEKAFRDLVRGKLPELPRQQQLVAETLLAHPRDAAFLSVPELAERAGVSEATIVRFAQRLGYEGFSALRTDLLEAFRRRLFAPEIPLPAEEGLGPRDTLGEVARLEMTNVRDSARDLDREAFRAAAGSLVTADHVYAFGLGISSHLAGLLCYLLTQIGTRATPLSGTSSSPLEQLVSLRPTDRLVVFSFPPYSRATLELARAAEDSGVPVVGVTDGAAAPIASIARVVLPVASENMMFTNAFAAVSVLLNAWVTEVALRNREPAARAVDRITRLLEDDPDLIDPGRTGPERP